MVYDLVGDKGACSIRGDNSINVRSSILEEMITFEKTLLQFVMLLKNPRKASVGFNGDKKDDEYLEEPVYFYKEDVRMLEPDFYKVGEENKPCTRVFFYGVEGHTDILMGCKDAKEIIFKK